jgi:hypothetical protein
MNKTTVIVLLISIGIIMGIISIDSREYYQLLVVVYCFHPGISIYYFNCCDYIDLSIGDNQLYFD